MEVYRFYVQDKDGRMIRDPIPGLMADDTAAFFKTMSLASLAPCEAWRAGRMVCRAPRPRLKDDPGV